ncbi:MAG: LysR substrate-binding domain-containing protein [Leucobacter sp.]
MSEHQLRGVDQREPIRLGFTRGVSPTKWANRWKRAVPERALELVPFEYPYGIPVSGDAAECDIHIVRQAPGTEPTTIDTHDVRTHHAMLLYEESVALVLPKDHELAEQTEIQMSDLPLIKILDYQGYAPQWSSTETWDDPSWKPKSLRAALATVATGAGGIIAPLPLARHLSNKQDHVLLRIVADEASLPGSTVWAVWRADHDSPDMQQLAGVMRGRTARSSRRDMSGAASAQPPKPALKQQPKKKKPTLKPNSRGAQLAAVREKAARAKAERAAAKRKKKR